MDMGLGLHGVHGLHLFTLYFDFSLGALWRICSFHRLGGLRTEFSFMDRLVLILWQWLGTSTW
jgi:hypothetical protein